MSEFEISNIVKYDDKKYTINICEDTFLNIINIFKNVVTNKPISDIDDIENIIRAIKNMESFHNKNSLNDMIKSLSKEPVCEIVEIKKPDKIYTSNDIAQMKENISIFEAIKTDKNSTILDSKIKNIESLLVKIILKFT